MAKVPSRLLGRARATGGRLQDGSTAVPMSGIRRELQRAAAALPMPALKACEGARGPLALASDERRPYESPGLDIFQMEIDSVGLGGDHDAPSDRLGVTSDTCSEASTESSVMLVLEDLLGGRGNAPGEIAAAEGGKAATAGRLFRNRSGHIPISRPAGGGGQLPAKPFGKLSKSLSGHRPRAGRLGEPDHSKGGLAPPARQLMKQANGSLQSWASNSREACLGEAERGQMDKSAPVPIVQRFGHRACSGDDDGDNPFIPPHEYLVMKELSDDPENGNFANPSTGRLKGLSSLRMRNMVLSETGYYDGYTEMWQQPGKRSPALIDQALETQFDFRF
eukprot:evm.model.scf_3429.1 EVM.evm.TU.scf_3429.1   scf_3429:2662-4902(-)